MTNILYTGGAQGADTLFYQKAKERNHLCFVYSFKGHGAKCMPHDKFELTDEQLQEADPFIDRANLVLQREKLKSRTDFVKNLLRRNYWQIKNTERIFAVASINWDENTVNGGTGWAVQMAIHKNVPHIYVFDQPSNLWYYWYRGKWRHYAPDVRMIKPEGRYTGIGSRQLTQKGIAAITELFVDIPVASMI